MDICRDTYVVRIYRRNMQDRQEVIGLVEIIGVEEKRAFKTFDELRQILHPVKIKGAGDKKERDAEPRRS